MTAANGIIQNALIAPDPEKLTGLKNGIHIHEEDPAKPTLASVSANLHERVTAFLATPYKDDASRATQAQVRRTLGIIEDALEQYPLEALSISYNGGKDCLVLLILFLASLHNLSQTNTAKPSTPLPSALQTVYILPPSPFPEVDLFVVHSVHSYALSLTRYALPMRTAFELYLAEKPTVKAILVGTRRTDPHGGGLHEFQRTDGGWPDFVRVLPVLEWRLREVWTFIREMKVPYCSLYDEGYTSLGGTNDTLPNPVLKMVDADGRERYRPAYELEDDEEERLGRE